MSSYHIPLLPNETYHLFNRAVGSEKMFLSEANYLYFLQKLKQHVLPVADLYTYSLLPNHFHLLVKIKEEAEVVEYFLSKKKKLFNSKVDSISDFVMEQFSNMFNSYTKSFNKMYNRKGALFIDFVKRSISRDDYDFSTFVFYIHKNAVHHGLVNNIGDWQFDGYNSILSIKHTLLLRNDLIDFFGSKEAFIKFHQQAIIKKNSNWNDFELSDFPQNL